MRTFVRIALGAGVLMAAAMSWAADVPELAPVERIPLPANLPDAENLSGIALLPHGRVVVCTDEVAGLEVLERAGDQFKKTTSPKLGAEGTEIDLEGLASQGDVLYAVGSHSLARKQPDADKTYPKNRQRILEINEDANRDQLFRLTLDADGQVAQKDSINLRPLLLQHSLLRPFARLPSKENGIDIEGVAVREGQLYAGFRGPVLRGNYVPILRLDFDKPAGNELLLVNLDGQGIRDLTAVDDGFLILAGPVGDAIGQYAIYRWNGQDCLIGTDGPGGQCELVATLQRRAGGKPEGLAARRRSQGYELFVVFDGLSDAVYRYELNR